MEILLAGLLSGTRRTIYLCHVSRASLMYVGYPPTLLSNQNIGAVVTEPCGAKKIPATECMAGFCGRSKLGTMPEFSRCPLARASLLAAQSALHPQELQPRKPEQ